MRQVAPALVYSLRFCLLVGDSSTVSRFGGWTARSAASFMLVSEACLPLLKVPLRLESESEFCGAPVSSLTLESICRKSL